MLYVRAADRLERVEAKTFRRLNHNISVLRPRGGLLVQQQHPYTCTNTVLTSTHHRQEPDASGSGRAVGKLRERESAPRIIPGQN